MRCVSFVVSRIGSGNSPAEANNNTRRKHVAFRGRSDAIQSYREVAAIAWAPNGFLRKPSMDGATSELDKATRKRRQKRETPPVYSIEGMSPTRGVTT